MSAPKLTLYVGDKNLSSWSMRPYLALRFLGVPFAHEVIYLDRPDTAARIAAVSPSGRVPVLRDGELLVWDSLAIIEYLAERFPDGGLWPSAPAARAMARAACAEMHAGFAELRKQASCNVTARRPRPALTPALTADLARLETLWRQCRSAHGAAGPYLFGAFSAADCFFAPVATRFTTYDLPAAADTRAYLDALQAHPVVAAWIAEARAEAAETGSDQRPH